VGPPSRLQAVRGRAGYLGWVTQDPVAAAVDPVAAAVDPVTAAVDVEMVRSRVRALMPRVRADLEALVRIPSVSAAAFDSRQLLTSAEAVAGLLRAAGMPEVEILQAEVEGVPGAPAVVARRPAAPGAPTVLLYAHHDVQPPGDPQLWTTPAFEPVERDGRLYGRGAADDKGGIAVHLAAIRALGPDSPLGLTVFVEGEEETGSPSFAAFLRTYRERLAADVIVIADSGNWRLGRPALTTSLRGLVDGVIEVATLDHAVHSGMFGGAVPDAVTVLIRLLNGLWDDAGALAVPGLVAAEADLEYAEADLRVDAGVLDGVELVGSGALASRLWTRPSLTITGIDVPAVATASNTLLPAVQAKFSLRLAPGQDPQAAFDALRAQLLATAPWGARVEVRIGGAGRPWAGDVDGPVYDTARWALRQAYGHEAVHMGLGGSIPFIAELGEAYPGATVLVTGVEDPDTRAHGTDESLHLAEFERACVAHALLLVAVAAPSGL
jgi:acetylornithine deacetylase/succinyl-diaminopimelate desuccinylase-like protein